MKPYPRMLGEYVLAQRSPSPVNVVENEATDLKRNGPRVLTRGLAEWSSSLNAPLGHSTLAATEAPMNGLYTKAAVESVLSALQENAEKWA